MKPLHFLGVGLIGIAMLSSCSKTDDRQQAVTDFSTDFATKAQANQLDSLRAVYPLLERADSVHVNFSADSLKVEATPEGLYKVTFNSTSSIIVNYSEDGKMTVKESSGVIAWPEKSVAFAKAIGGIKPEMNDSAKSVVMDNLDAVRSSLADDYIKSRSNAIKVSRGKVTRVAEFSMDQGRGYTPLTNTTDTDIKGDEYTIITKIYYNYTGMKYGYTTETEKGKDIPAKGTIKVPFVYYPDRYEPINVKVKMKTPSAEQFMANYKPKGDEWANYVKAHPEALKPNTEKLSDGPYEITGKIGGKYAITMHLNKGMKDGKYYYNKNGEKNSLTLSVKSFNPRTGDIVLEETAPDGKRSGTFTGKLTKEAFKGKMDVYNGKSFNFDLAVK